MEEEYFIIGSIIGVLLLIFCLIYYRNIEINEDEEEFNDSV